ncbi:uncharacterized protein SOCG_04210 [Schizosaccharomyces octosporus yFS286]|uniref:RRM domain-containing protein n=1 Tax=Schizosaccharomyces octosporus (strain yFS286) TaxID=483514 RepID=S9PRX6_SCHOY|nr:uncharacterized protein SOCG_04210 [Schizosaccharomyces octosporus yFS286]EPX70747.1 hypothetical protein SOCG_04210 [Schizosaccharomyces octosporus yFS286]
MQQSSRPSSLSMNIRVKHPMDGPIFSPMTYCNPYMPPVPTSIPMGIMQSHMKPMHVNFSQLPFPIPFTVLAQSGSNEQANILANFRMDTSQRPPHPQPSSDTDKNRVDELANFQVLPHGYWDYRAMLIHNMPSLYNVSEFLDLNHFGTLERIVPLYDQNQLFLAFLSAADALDFYNTVRYTDFTFLKQRLLVSTIDPMPLEPHIIDACNRGFVSRNVQISGLPSDFNEAPLIQYVCSLGKAELISVCTQTHSIYIHYLSIEDALNCINSVLLNPYYSYLNCCCFYERCDRYYYTDYQVEKVEAGFSFSNPQAEINAHKSDKTSGEKKEKPLQVNSSIENIGLKPELKLSETKSNPESSFEYISQTQESCNVEADEEENSNPITTTTPNLISTTDKTEYSLKDAPKQEEFGNVEADKDEPPNPIATTVKPECSLEDTPKQEESGNVEADEEENSNPITTTVLPESSLKNTSQKQDVSNVEISQEQIPNPVTTTIKPERSLEDTPKQEESSVVAPEKKDSTKPLRTTKTKSVRISDPEVIPFENQRHSSPKRSVTKQFHLSDKSFHENHINSPQSKASISRSVLECHSRIAALQNVTNTSTMSSPPKSILSQSSKKYVSSVVNTDTSPTPQMSTKSEHAQEQPMLHTNLNEPAVLQTNSKSHWYDDESFESDSDDAVNRFEDMILTNKSESFPEDLHSKLNSLYRSDIEDELKHESTKFTAETLPSNIYPSSDATEQLNTSLNTIIEEQEPDTFEFLHNPSSVASLPKELPGDNPVNDLASLTKISTESCSSRSSSAVSSPTLVGSPIEAPAKTFTDLSEIDIMSKPSNDIPLIPDLEPCSKNRTLFLSGFHRTTKQFEIGNLLKGFPLEEVRFLSKKKICFVTFLESYDAKLFLDAHEKQSLYLHGRPLKIEWAKCNNPFTDELLYAIANGASRSISFENIHPSVTRSDLISLLKIYGPVESFHFSKPKNVGLITYNSIYSTIKAMKHLQSHPTLKKTILNYFFDDQHCQKNMLEKKQFCRLEETKGNHFSNKIFSDESPKISSCFDALGSHPPSQLKNTKFRRPKHRASVSSEESPLKFFSNNPSLNLFTVF